MFRTRLRLTLDGQVERSFLFHMEIWVLLHLLARHMEHSRISFRARRRSITSHFRFPTRPYLLKKSEEENDPQTGKRIDGRIEPRGKPEVRENGDQDSQTDEYCAQRHGNSIPQHSFFSKSRGGGGPKHLSLPPRPSPR